MASATLSARYVACFFFFFNDTATTEIYTLSLHDALPISEGVETSASLDLLRQADCDTGQGFLFAKPMPAAALASRTGSLVLCRSEEHTSELQSLTNIVCRLLPGKKKTLHDQESL